MSDYYDACCHPEIMDALVYALNDSDERVRAKAADEIGDQMRVNQCCVGPDVICALKFTLGDCDSGVRRQAEEALHIYGYDIVNGTCCPVNCCNSQCAVVGAPPADQDAAPADPIPAEESAAPAELEPVPAPQPNPTTPEPQNIEAPVEPEAETEAVEAVKYFPARLHKEYANRRGSNSSKFASFFGLGTK